MVRNVGTERKLSRDAQVPSHGESMTAAHEGGGETDLTPLFR
jgi:hypothetical protein